MWSLNGQRWDLVDEQRYLIWKHCNEHSEAWPQAKAQQRRRAKEREAAKGNGRGKGSAKTQREVEYEKASDAGDGAAMERLTGTV